MMTVSRLFGGAALVGAAMLSMTGAKADVILTFVGTQASGTPGVTNFVYNLNLPVNSSLSTNDFVTFYDVAGLTGGSINAAMSRTSQFTVSQALLGNTPPTQAPPDSPTAMNITFTYTGAGISGPTDQAGFPLAQLFIGSTGSSVVTGTNAYSAQSNNATTGKAYNTTFVTGPGVVPAAPPVTPEPGAVAMLVGMGVTGAGFLARRKRSK